MTCFSFDTQLAACLCGLAADLPACGRLTCSLRCVAWLQVRPTSLRLGLPPPLLMSRSWCRLVRVSFWCSAAATAAVAAWAEERGSCSVFWGGCYNHQHAGVFSSAVSNAVAGTGLSSRLGVEISFQQGVVTGFALVTVRPVSACPLPAGSSRLLATACVILPILMWPAG